MAAVPAFRALSSDEESSASPAQSIFVTMISPGGPVNLGASTSGTSGKGPPVHWSEAETWPLIRLWEDNIGELRRQRRNAGVNETIRLGLERLPIDKTRKQVSDKIDNLNQTYRDPREPLSQKSGDSEVCGHKLFLEFVRCLFSGLDALLKLIKFDLPLMQRPQNAHAIVVVHRKTLVAVSHFHHYGAMFHGEFSVTDHVSHLQLDHCDHSTCLDRVPLWIWIR
ncbi:hypothetical protein HPB47_014640 [Ixodes persulcatus]|uniref:Uncharacterized protein n=1 Tax=Ixodes persulcatus TaxID=34615 RepID=A0AC60QWD3_IXOPE|nr:hypothetical protein HPB47_014640 [Ixodes persulcatus]